MEIDTVNVGHCTIFVNYQPGARAFLVDAPGVPLEYYPVDALLTPRADYARVAALYAAAHRMRGVWVLADVKEHCSVYRLVSPAFVVPS